MASKYPWAVNEKKEDRAIQTLKKAASAKALANKSEYVEPTEEEVKAEYIKYAGLVAESPVEEVKEEEVITPPKRQYTHRR